MAPLIKVLRAEAIRTFQEERAYAIQWLAGVVTTGIFLFGLTFALESFGVGAPGEAAANLTVGIFIWYLGLQAISRMSYYVLGECTLGTIETIYLSPAGPAAIYVSRALSQVFMDLVTIIPIVAVFTWVKGISLHVSIVPVFAIMVVTIIGIYGFGFALAGLTIVYKRTSSVAGIIEYILLFFTGAIVTVETMPAVLQYVSLFLPLSLGITLLRKVMVAGYPPLSVICAKEFWLLVGNSLAYLLIGVLIFYYGDHVARKRGVIGRY